MTKYTKKFICLDCKGENFGANYKFSVEFKDVNFTDRLIYDKITEASYFCKECGKVYSQEFIQESIQKTIDKYKTDEWENQEGE